MKLKFSTDYEACVSEYLMPIKFTNDNKYDLLANKNSKFHFYHFNNYHDVINILQICKCF